MNLPREGEEFHQGAKDLCRPATKVPVLRRRLPLGFAGMPWEGSSSLFLMLLHLQDLGTSSMHWNRNRPHICLIWLLETWRFWLGRVFAAWSKNTMSFACMYEMSAAYKWFSFLKKLLAPYLLEWGGGHVGFKGQLEEISSLSSTRRSWR